MNKYLQICIFNSRKKIEQNEQYIKKYDSPIELNKHPFISFLKTLHQRTYVIAYQLNLKCHGDHSTTHTINADRSNICDHSQLFTEECMPYMPEIINENMNVINCSHTTRIKYYLSIKLVGQRTSR